MKKLFLFFIFLLVGCSSTEKPVNLYDLSKKLDEIELNSINIEKAVSVIQNELLEEELIDVSSDIAKIMDLTKLKQYVFYQSEETYIFIYETKDKNISNIMTNYFEDMATKQITISLREKLKNRVEYQYEDFYIYIIDNQASKILEQILETKNKLFENTTSLSESIIEEKLGFKIPNAIVKFSTKLNSEVGYILIPESTGEIEEKCDNYFLSKDDELSKGMLKFKKDNYLMYIISYDNNKALEIIESTNLQ